MHILLIGYGKMGKAIAARAAERGHHIAGILDLENQNTFRLPPRVDVAVEFTSPEAAIKNMYFCFRNRIPVVCGSTGWYGQLDEVLDCCKQHNGGLLYASNFSIGVNIVFKVNEYLARLMSPHRDYEVLVDETHHTHKKDAPSGTAISLAQGILRENTSKKRWVSHPSLQPDEIEIRSHRMGEVSGTHVVSYTSPTDSIRLSHEAHTRDGFVWGAVLAAEFLVGKQGVYTMADVLRF